MATEMKLFGQHAPGEQQDGYAPGAWDEVRNAFMDGHISEEAYDVLRLALQPLREQQEKEESSLGGSTEDDR